jgi:predicted dinucleotide-binding enzyme
MDIGIIGSGRMGGVLGTLWARQGHRVCFSYSRDLARLERLAVAVGGNARSGTPQEAAQFGEVVLLAVPWALALGVITQVAPLVAGKALLTCVIPWNEDRSGLAVGTDRSAAEEISRHLPSARIAEVLGALPDSLGWINGGRQRPAMFYCGYDPQAKAVAAQLIEDLNAEPIDAGCLHVARYLEPAAALLQHLAVGQGYGPEIGLQLVRPVD